MEETLVDMRHNGASFAEIAALLGVTISAADGRFRKLRNIAKAKAEANG